MNEMLEKLKAYLESDEGKKKSEEYFAKLARAEKINKRQVKRINRYIKTLSSENLHSLVLKYCKWEEKHQDMLYKRGIDGSSTLMDLIFDFFRKYGKGLKCDEMFESARYGYGKYEMSLFVGQGSFYKIEYIEKTRLI